MATSPAELVKSLVDAGVHFGHRVSRWNPKMQPYISGKRNMIHIIDVKETVKGLLRAKKLVQSMVAQGKDVLFVGTKRQARFAVEEEAKRCGMHYVSERWLGGTLTNFRTIRDRLKRLDELEKLWETGQIETDSDPDPIDLPIPGNDDAMRAIEIIMKELADSIIEGKTGRTEKGEADQ